MKHNYKKCLYAFLLLLTTTTASAQEEMPATVPVFTADSLRSGNSKDVLTSFFQLAFDNLTGNNKEFNFQSNPFAVMLKSNPNLNIDHYYSKYYALRKLNFGFGIRLDTSFRFNGFSSGVKYALVDQRDHTTSKLFAARLGINGFFNERKKLNAALQEIGQQRFLASPKTAADRKIWDEYRKTISKFFNQEVAFDNLENDFQELVKKVVQDSSLNNIDKVLKQPGASLRSNDIAVFEALKDSIKRCALWTIGISDTMYSNQFAFSNVVLHTEFSKGIFTPKAGANNIELNIRAAGNFSKDETQSGNNLKRFVLDAEAGFNWVIRDKLNQKSWFEFMLSGTYYRNFTRLYQDEDRNRITVNGTARVRIYEDIWVPFEIKYDPANGNVFGLFNVRANFTAMKQLVRGALK